jgi:membrane protein YqaA with SNARE-associated domain
MEYGGLFAAAFLAATLLPFPSEVPLGFLVRSEQQILWPVLVATAGNYLGASTTYWLARGVLGRRTAAPERTGARALSLFRRYGAPALLLSWVPVAGDGIVAVAGAARLPFAPFSAWTIAGKAARYVAVAWLALRA